MNTKEKTDYLDEETIRMVCEGSFDARWLLKSQYEGYARKCLDSMIAKYDLDICPDDEEDILWNVRSRLARVLMKRFNP